MIGLCLMFKFLALADIAYDGKSREVIGDIVSGNGDHSRKHTAILSLSIEIGLTLGHR